MTCWDFLIDLVDTVINAGDRLINSDEIDNSNSGAEILLDLVVLIAELDLTFALKK